MFYGTHSYQMLEAFQGTYSRDIKLQQLCTHLSCKALKTCHSNAPLGSHWAFVDEFHSDLVLTDTDKQKHVYAHRAHLNTCI